METVELIRGLEEEFSIYLPDSELVEVYTVGNLYSLLLRKLKPTSDCLTSKAFYRIRRAITAAIGLPRRSVGPATFLDDIFSEHRIREQWSAIQRESGLKLPRLLHTAMWKHWMQIVSAVLSFVCTVALIRTLSRFPLISLNDPWMFFSFLIIGLILWGVLYRMHLRATPFRRSVLPTLSVGELARVALSMNSADLAFEPSESARLTDSQVWTRLVGVFCDQLACEPEDVVPSASILVDLVQS